MQSPAMSRFSLCSEVSRSGQWPLLARTEASLENEGALPAPRPISRGFPATEEPSPVLLIKTHLFKLKVFFKGVCL